MRTATVAIKVDASGLERALRKLNGHLREFAIGFRRAGRNGWRMRLTAGEQHIDRIARDCAARRLDAATTARRLLVAVDVAAVIDGTERAA